MALNTIPLSPSQLNGFSGMLELPQGSSSGTISFSSSSSTVANSLAFSSLGECPVEQISHHTCNSVYPAVSFDMVGNAGVVWHDSRDGNWEIYFKALATHLSGKACCGRISPQTVTGSSTGFSGQCSVGFSSISLASTYSVDDTGTDTTSAGATTTTAATLQDTGEARITCTEGPTLFPDVVADRKGRFHVVYQDQISAGSGTSSNSSKFEIRYNQVYPQEIGEKKDCASGVSTNGDFGSAAGGVADNYGTFFTHGDPLMADLKPNNGSGVPTAEQTGLHRLFKSSGSWAGVSKESDYALWLKQVGTPPPSGWIPPPYVAKAGNEKANVGDFGSSYDFKSLALMTQSPPYNPIEISVVRLPIKPRCIPIQALRSSSGMRTQDLVSAPARPLPPTFVDPVSVSSVLGAPGTQVDASTAPRYTIDGDESTIFTNILTDGGQNRLVFHKQTSGAELKFVLGQVRCGTENCAVKVSESSLSTTTTKKIKLQVWEGGNYRDDDTLVGSNSLGATLVLEKEFSFEPGDDCTRFAFRERELRVRRGRILFFVPTSDEFDFYVDGVGGGHAVWSTGGDGTFKQYYVPYTVSPNSGMNAPIYYEGKLLTPQCAESTTGAAKSVQVTSLTANTMSYQEYMCDTYGQFNYWCQHGYSSNYTLFKVQMTVSNRTSSYVFPTGEVTISGNSVSGFSASVQINSGFGYIGPGQTSTMTGTGWNFGSLADGTYSFTVTLSFKNQNSANVAEFTVGTGRFACTSNVLSNSVPITQAVLESQPELTTVTGVSHPFGAAYSPTAKALVLSLNSPGGTPNNFSAINDDATTPYGTDDVGLIKGIAGSLFIDVARDEGGGTSRGGFKAGEMLADGGGGDVIRFDPDGKKSATYTLANETVRGLCIDRANVVAGDLVVGCASGNVWRIDSSGQATKVGSTGSAIEGVVTVPNQDVYGPWAGKILACSPASSKVYAMAPSGENAGYSIQLNSVILSPGMASTVYENENMFIASPSGSSSGTAGLGTVMGIDASGLVNKWDSIILAQLSPGKLWEAKWNAAATPQAFVFNEIAVADSLGQMTFTDAGLGTIKTVSVCQSDDPDAPVNDPSDGCGNYGNIASLMVSVPRTLTSSSGNSEHARLAIDNNDNIWMAFHSDRSGANEVYVSRYVGNCGTWISSGAGGSDIRLSSFGPKGQAKFPNVAVDANGEAHVVFQGTAPEDGKWEIYYVRSTGGGKAFTDPVRLTSSPNDAMMPDIVITYPQSVGKKITVVWHDDRFGNFEIMAATYSNGEWNSSGQGGSDLRITQTRFKSVFPRIAADFNSNMRVVYQSYRSTDPNSTTDTLPSIFMSTYVASKDQWESSGQGWSDREMSQTPEGASSMAPDIDIECQNGPMTVWHDDRLNVTTGNPNQHEEVFGAYCTRLTEHFGGPHFKPLDGGAGMPVGIGIPGTPGGGGTPTSVPYRDMGLEFKIVQITSLLDDIIEIEATNSPDISLVITAPGATFWRAANEDGVPSEWEPFRGDIDLDTMVVPWRLSCASGTKRVCVQVQDSQFVSYPTCKNVTLTAPPPTFTIELFSDSEMLNSLPLFNVWPAAKAGTVYVKLTSNQLLLENPTFDVVSRGLHIVSNQQTSPMADASEAVTVTSASGGTTTNYSAGHRTFKGDFDVYREDGLFHIDGLARLVPHGKDPCGNPF